VLSIVQSSSVKSIDSVTIQRSFVLNHAYHSIILNRQLQFPIFQPSTSHLNREDAEFASQEITFMQERIV
jgi:hypothetical protein